MRFSRSKIIWLLLVLNFVFLAEFSLAGTPVNEDGSTNSLEQKPTGETEARKFFRNPSTTDSASTQSGSSSTKTITAEDHYLGLHLGAFMGGDSYQWGSNPKVSNPGRLTAGVTYRMGQMSALADWVIRGDFIGYSLPENNALQLGIVPMVMFPDSSSHFPLYFGFGAGPGLFFQQIQAESFLALDYQLVGGVRFFNVLESTGFFIETGLKNHIHLLSDGQFNGLFLAGGALFTF